MSNRTSPIPPSDEEVASRKLTEARYSPEALAVPNRRSCLSRIRGIRGPQFGVAHPARYPTVSRFILEDWAGQDGLRLSFCRQAHLFPRNTGDSNMYHK